MVGIFRRAAAARRSCLTAGHRFDLGAEPVAAGSPALLRRIADRAQQVLVETAGEQLAVLLLPFVRRPAERMIDRMFGQQRIGLAERIEAVARLGILAGLRHYAGA